MNEFAFQRGAERIAVAIERLALATFIGLFVIAFAVVAIAIGATR